jgi:hypothetical protein
MPETPCFLGEAVQLNNPIFTYPIAFVNNRTRLFLSAFRKNGINREKYPFSGDTLPSELHVTNAMNVITYNRLHLTG